MHVKELLPKRPISVTAASKRRSGPLVTAWHGKAYSNLSTDGPFTRMAERLMSPRMAFPNSSPSERWNRPLALKL